MHRKPIPPRPLQYLPRHHEHFQAPHTPRINAPVFEILDTPAQLASQQLFDGVRISSRREIYALEGMIERNLTVCCGRIVSGGG